MSGALASLIVDLQLNSASLRDGLDAARGKVKGFAAEVNAAFDSVHDMAKGVKRAAGEIAQAGLGLAAVAGGAVALAAQVDKGIAAEVKNLKNSFADLAVPVAQMVVPAMRELASEVRTVADFVASLSPQTKTFIADFLKVAVVVGGAALVISKVAAAIGALAGVIAAITAGPMLAFLGVVAVVAVGAVFLHKVWRENWVGIRDAVKSVVSAIAGYWQTFVGYVSDIMGALWRRLIDGAVFFGKAFVTVLETVGKLTGEQADAMRGAMETAGNLVRENGGLIVEAGIRFAEDLAIDVKDGLVAAVKAMAKEGKLVVKELLDLAGLSISGAAGAAGRHELKAAPAPLQAFGDFAIAGARDAALDIGLAGKIAADEVAAVGKLFMSGGIEAAADVAKAATQFADAMVVGGQLVLRKLGDVGQIISSAISGFQTAGPWGAVIAVIGEILTRLEVFTKFSDMLNAKLFASLGELSAVLTPLFEMIGEFSTMLNPIREIIHSIIGFVFGVLKPIFEVVGAIFKGLGEVLSPIADALSAVFDAILSITDSFNLLDGIVYTTGLSFKAIGVVIGFAMAGIMTSALGVIRLVQEILKAVGASYAGIKKTGDDLEDKIKAMQKSWGEGWDKYDPTKAPPIPAPPPPPHPGIDNLDDKAQKVAETFDEMVHNIPNVWKGLKAAQWAAGGGNSSSTASSAAGTGGLAGVGFDPGNLLGNADYTGVFQGADGSAGSVGANVVPFMAGEMPWVDTTSIDVGEQGMGEVGIDYSKIDITGPVTIVSNDPIDMYKQLKEIAKTEAGKKGRTANSPLP